MPTKTQVDVYNEQRLKLISPSIRDHIAAIIKDMQAAGWTPMIDVGVYRTPAQQLEKYRKGVSKVTYSYHNVTDKGGVPASLAADIIDANYLVGWNPPRKYVLQLAAAAENQGLQTGAYFGLSRSQKDDMHMALGRHNYEANIEIGWDGCHVQPWQWRWPLWAVKSGIRPKLPPVKRGLFQPLLVVNNIPIPAAYLHEGHWYCVIDKLAAATGAASYYNGTTVMVADQLKAWGLDFVANNRIKERGRFDIRTSKEEKK